MVFLELWGYVGVPLKSKSGDPMDCSTPGFPDAAED